MKIISNNDVLSHYGIKGQKWGQRNYQHYDGTLTEEGKARYYGSVGGINTPRGSKSTKKQNAISKLKSSISKSYKSIPNSVKTAGKVALGAALAVGAGYALSKISVRKKLINKIRSTFNENSKIVKVANRVNMKMSDAERGIKSGLNKAGAKLRSTGNAISGAAANAGSNIKSTAKRLSSTLSNNATLNKAGAKLRSTGNAISGATASAASKVAAAAKRAGTSVGQYVKARQAQGIEYAKGVINAAKKIR